MDELDLKKKTIRVIWKLVVFFSPREINTSYNEAITIYERKIIMKNRIKEFVEAYKETQEAVEDDYNNMSRSEQLSVDVLVVEGELRGELMAAGAIIVGYIVGTIIKKAL